MRFTLSTLGTYSHSHTNKTIRTMARCGIFCIKETTNPHIAIPVQPAVQCFTSQSETIHHFTVTTAQKNDDHRAAAEPIRDQTHSMWCGMACIMCSVNF